MDVYGVGGNIPQSSKLQDLQSFGANPTGSAVFDASQYEFFGNDVVEEIELGGLEDDDDDPAAVGFEEQEFQLEGEEGDKLESLSELDDLSNTFSKLNKVVSWPRSTGVGGGWESRESSSAAEWAQEADFSSWFDRPASEAENTHETNRWSSHAYPSPHFMESKSLHRSSSYPEQQLQHPHQQQNLHHQYSSEPILIPKSSFTSYPPSGSFQQASPSGQSCYPNIPIHPGAHQMPISASKFSPFSNHQLHMNALPHGLQLSRNLPQLPHGLPVNNMLQNQWVNQSNQYPGDRSGIQNNVHPLTFQNGLMPPQPMLPQQLQPSVDHLSGMQLQSFNHHLSASPPMMNSFDMVGLPDLRDQRAISMLRNRQGMRYPHQISDLVSQRADSRWPRFRSKYMSADELENILRMQLAATHSDDPYVDDYYHQACVARKSAGGKLRHHFCPTVLRDSPSRPQTSNEPHRFLQVDALGRVCFSSIRRPRPLLEVDSLNSSSESGTEQLAEKPLQEEPLLGARVAIEDGICLLLDVDDIDRFMQFNQLQDGGTQLKQRRQVLLEGLASSLQLVDPLQKDGDEVNIAPKDEHVFLRLVSLPKGRKLLLRYLQLLLPGELTRVVCMAIFRHLRFFFGNLLSDPGASAIIVNLAMTVSSCVHGMELKAVAACLASVVCSTEHPPLRPICSPAGDEASVVLKSILERATQLLTGPLASSPCSTVNRAFWQASFDAFFSLLTKYCFSKYDSVVQSFHTLGSMDRSTTGSDVAKAIGREMPVELVKASLPHTNEQQRKILLEFVQRSMPVLGFSGQSGANGCS